MNGTLRGQIKRRMYWCLGIFACGWVVMVLGTELAKSLPDVPREIIPVGGMLLFGGAALAMHWLVRCPKCEAKLARTIAMPVAFSWGSGPKIGFCPYCGVNLDQPLPQTGVQAGNPIHPA